MSIRKYCEITGLVLIAALMFSSCEYFKPKHEQDLETKQQNASENSQNGDVVSDQGQSVTNKVVPAEVRVSAVPSKLRDCVTGDVTLTRLARASEMFAGPFASASVGDFIFENDQIRFAVTLPAGLRGGNELCDIVNKKRAVAPDYLEYFKMLPDLETTGSAFVWDTYSAEKRDKYNVTLNVQGCVGKYTDDPMTSRILKRDEGIRAETTWTLHACSNVVEIATAIYNNTSESVSLLPGDMIGPGEGKSFVEGIGFVSTPFEMKANWALASTDDWSVGLVNYTGKIVEGIFSPQFWMVRQFGEGPIQSPLISRADAVADKNAETTKSQAETFAPKEKMPTVVTPAKTDSDRLRNDIQKLKSREVLSSPPTETQQEIKGGGEKTDSVTSSSRLVLAPGESYVYTRGLVVSDADMSRVAYELIRTKIIEKTNVLAGVVVEDKTNYVVPDSDLLISGGPGWDGKGEPAPYLLTKTNDQGAFAVQLPDGIYEVLPTKVGRIALSSPPVIKLRSSSEPKMLNLILSQQSIANVAVADGDSAARVGLPSKLTIETVDGLRPFEFPFTGEAELGVRNVLYMPDGAARFPLTPGKYMFTVSRGIEYDIQKFEVNIAPGVQTKNIVSLKKVVPTDGMISLDANIVTTASASSMLTPQSAVVMAACEGVNCIISGDYGTATDLQPYIKAYGYEKKLKALRGMRTLVGGYDNQKGDFWIFPIANDADQNAVTKFCNENSQNSADVFLSLFKKAFPDKYVQVNDPLEVNKGYLANLTFSDVTGQYDEMSIPPSDFDGLSVMEKSARGYYSAMQDRYNDLQRHRVIMDGGHAISPVAFSGCDSPINSEIGYPRMYIWCSESLPQLSEKTVHAALMKQRFMVTNGPILQTAMLNPNDGKYDKLPGTILDASTTDIVRIKIHVMAAPWIDCSDIKVNKNGRAERLTTIQPLTTIERFPLPNVQRTDSSGRYTLDVDKERDCFVDVVATGFRRSLYPVVTSRPRLASADIYPIAWVGPTFIDSNGDGYIGGVSGATGTPGQPENPAAVTTDDISTETQRYLDKYFE